MFRRFGLGCLVVKQACWRGGNLNDLVRMAVSGAFRFGRGRESERATKREGGSFSSRQVKFARRAGFMGKRWGR